jgi:hypothetical protein
MEDNLELGPAFRKEVQVSKVYGDIVVVGKCDMFDEDTVYDFKTIRALWYLPKVDPANKHSAVTFYRHHVPQLNMYADIIGRENISIIYVDKGSLDIRQFTMKSDKKVVEEAVKKFHDVAEVMDYKENPFDYCGCFVCKEEEKRAEKAKEDKEWKRV